MLSVPFDLSVAGTCAAIAAFSLAEAVAVVPVLDVPDVVDVLDLLEPQPAIASTVASGINPLASLLIRTSYVGVVV
jgi:hypothetical protein